MQNDQLDESQAGMKITGRNINHLRYADDTTHQAEREEELNSLLMKVKEESEEADLKISIQKKKKNLCIQCHHFKAKVKMKVLSCV